MRGKKKENCRKQKSAQKRNYDHSTLPGCAATCARSYRKASTLCWLLAFRVDTQTCLEDFVAVSAEDTKAGSHKALSRARINPEACLFCAGVCLRWSAGGLSKQLRARALERPLPALTLTGSGRENELCSLCPQVTLWASSPRAESTMPDPANAQHRLAAQVPVCILKQEDT